MPRSRQGSSSRVIDSLPSEATVQLLLALCRAWDVSHARTYLGEFGYGGEKIWPEASDGRLKGVDWFQYFAPEWPPKWRAEALTPMRERIRLEPDGSACVVLGADPLAHLDYTTRLAAAEALGFETPL